MNYLESDFDDFLDKIYNSSISSNDGGMHSPDCFSLYVALIRLQPETVIECGCWKNVSTNLIKNTLKNINIIISDPYKHQIENFKGTDYTGNNFIDFKDIDISGLNLNKTLVIFDDHQNAVQRLLQCKNKGIKHIIFNDNYPVNCGSHFSLEHLKNDDVRDIFELKKQLHYSINKLEQVDLSKKEEILKLIKHYHIFPNIFKSKINLMEGIVDSEGYFDFYDKSKHDKYKVFYNERKSYSWNTYVELF